MGRERVSWLAYFCSGFTAFFFIISDTLHSLRCDFLQRTDANAEGFFKKNGTNYISLKTRMPIMVAWIPK